MDFAELLLVVFLVAAFAALMQAAVGFGFAVVFTPLLSLAMTAREAITVSLALGAVLSLTMYVAARPRAPLRSVITTFLAATVATPLGIYVLAIAGEQTLRGAIGAGVLLSVLGTVLTPHPVAERPRALVAELGVGALSGVLRGAVGMGGPPVVLYEHWRGASMTDIRGRLLAFFALTAVSGTLMAAGSGIFTRQSLLLSAAGVPAVGIAILGGRFIRPRLSPFWFRMISMALLVSMAVVSILGALR